MFESRLPCQNVLRKQGVFLLPKHARLNKNNLSIIKPLYILYHTSIIVNIQKSHSNEWLLIFVLLFCKFNATSFSNNVNFNLTRIFHFAFNLFGDIFSQKDSRCIVNHFWLNDNTNFSTCLYSKRF